MEGEIELEGKTRVNEERKEVDGVKVFVMENMKEEGEGITLD